MLDQKRKRRSCAEFFAISLVFLIFFKILAKKFEFCPNYRKLRSVVFDKIQTFEGNLKTKKI